MPVAGKQVIDFILDTVLPLNPSEIIIVHDRYTEVGVKRVLSEYFPNLTFKFSMQYLPLGTGHAIYQTKEHIHEGDEIVIAFCDMIIGTDISRINTLKNDSDGIIFGIEVNDPENYGVLVHKNNIITDIIEKAKDPPSNMANMGLFYFKDGYKFINTYLQKVMDAGKNTQGEYYITDAFTFMVADNNKLLVEKIDYVLDTGTVDKLIEANKFLLKSSVVKADDVIIENSEIGENVSIASNTVIRNCKISNSIIGSNTILEGMEIKDSLIGSNVTMKREGQKINIGDGCSME